MKVNHFIYIKYVHNCARIMKVRTYSCCFSAKELHRSKSLSCLEFGDVVITRRLSLAEY
jgi:hypothetical protein